MLSELHVTQGWIMWVCEYGLCWVDSILTRWSKHVNSTRPAWVRVRDYDLFQIHVGLGLGFNMWAQHVDPT